jgi:hypothetical protein
MARETFVYSIVPWAGRKYVPWVTAWADAYPHPRDPTGLVQLPEAIYRAFQERTPGQRLSKQQAEALGYPRVPGEQDLARVRKELHEALGRGDWERAQDLDARVRTLQERVAGVQMSALRSHPRPGT